ncbi:MAG: glycosyltransferase [Lachnospiraceae bacterium]|nr:glycosyltransferase [Lachnospiraceae bacterium]
MTLQVLLSAMHLADESYLDSLHVTSDAVVINQCDRTARRDVERRIGEKTQHVRYIESTQRGLSRSRNMAIRNAQADICILCDNDVEYVDGYEDMILSAFGKHPDADLIVFYIQRREKPVPNYPTERRMRYLSVMKIFSPEIAFRRKAVQGIPFHEEFGAGSGKYLMGEENIFLWECLKAHKKIYYEPVMIAKLREEASTWFHGYDEAFFLSRGAGYAAMDKMFSHFLIWQFAVRKIKIYQKDTGFFKALSLMYKGRARYLRDRK